MAWAEKVVELDEHIAVAVKTALRNLQSDLDERLKQSTEAMRERLGALEALLPASFVADSDLAPIAKAAEHNAREQAFTELRDALAAIDSAPSQVAILSTLLERSAPSCSRGALFLTPEGRAKGLLARGFTDASRPIEGVSFAYSEGSAWGELALGRSVVALSSADAAEVAQELETVVAREAVLIPLVLADRVAAALYADRVGPDGTLLVPALQSLVAAAAQAIELLPLRSRTATPTFAVPGTSSGAGLALWTTSPPAAAAPAPEPVPMAAAPLAAETAVIESPTLSSAAAFEPVEAPIPEVMLPPLAPPWESSVEVEDFAVEGPETATIEPPSELLSSAFTEPMPAVAAPPAPAWPEFDLETPLEYELPPVADLAPAEPSALAELDLPPIESLPAPRFEPATAAFEAPAGLPDVSSDETILLARSAIVIPPPAQAPILPPIAEPEMEEEPEEATHPGRAGFTPPRAPERGSAVREVRPPTDFEGPGLAFAGGARGTASEGTAHEEARRLARLLVSEIRLYNEDQVEEGRRNRDIYSRLRDEIDRSRKMFEERVSPDVRAARDYFTEELIRRLADGDPDALGM